MPSSPSLLLVVLPYMVAPQKSTANKGVRSFLAFPYGVLTLASYIERYAQSEPRIRILDLNLYDPENLVDALADELARYAPDIVGISFTFDVSYKHAAWIAKQVKEQDDETLVVMGGAAATVSYNEILAEQPHLDAVCYSEGEVAMRRLIDADDWKAELHLAPWVTRETLEQNIVPQTCYVDNLNDVIDLNYDLVDVDAYSMKEAFSPFASYRDETGIRQFFLVTSRGCPFKCVFCAEPAFHGSAMRYADVDTIISHVELLVKKYGMNVLTFYDDQLLLNQDRAKELFRRLAQFDLRIEMPNGVTLVYIDDELASLMKAAGVDTIFLAIESGSDYVLRDIIKKPLKIRKAKPVIEALQRHNIFVQAFFIIGFPGEREADRQQTLAFIKEMGIDWSFFNFATPLRGSELHRICKENGWLDEENQGIGDVDMTRYVIRAPGIDPDHITAQIYEMNLEANFVNNHRMRIGDYETAVRCFKEVVDRHPRQPFAHYFLAAARDKLEIGTESAVENRRRYIELIAEDRAWRDHAQTFGLVTEFEVKNI